MTSTIYSIIVPYMKDLIKILRPPQTVEDFMVNHDQWVKARSRQLEVLAKFITAQTLLHLPYYNQDTIVNASEKVLREKATDCFFPLSMERPFVKDVKLYQILHTYLLLTEKHGVRS